MDPKLKYYGLSLLTGAAAMFVVQPAPAQQITGTPGSPSATTTISGKELPPPPEKFGGVIEESVKDSKPYWPPRVVPPKGAPNVLLIMTDDQGYGVSGTFGGVIPTPALDRVAKTGLRYTQFNSTALCSPTRAGADHRPQSSLGGLRRDYRVVYGLSGLRFRPRSGERHHRHDPPG
jgi:arylsulfatase